MLIPFDLLPNNARIWVYQSESEFTKEEEIQIIDFLTNFTQTWESHQQKLSSSFIILYNRFIILGVDEQLNAPGGCSIDKSVNQIRDLESILNIRLTDKNKVAYLNNENQIQFCDFRVIGELIKNNSIFPETTFFNLAITRKQELENWPTPAIESWLKRYFN